MKRLLIGLLVGGACLYWFLHNTDWSEMKEAFAAIQTGWVLVAVGSLLLEFVIRAIRWKIILRPLKPNLSVLDLFRAQVIGAAANTLLPLRLGELVKPTIVSNRSGLPFVSVATTAIMERVYDLFGMVSVLVIMVLFLQSDLTPPPEQQILIDNLRLYGGILGVCAITAMGVFFYLVSRKNDTRHIFASIVQIAPPPIQRFFLGLFDGFVDGLANSTDTKGIWQAGILSVGMWLNGALAIFCLFNAFALSLPFGAACFIAVAIALAVVLPQAPGFVGVFHAAIEATLLLWGQDPIVAKGFAIVFWGVSFIPVTVLGVGLGMFENIEWKKLTVLLHDDEAKPLPSSQTSKE